MRGVVSPRSIPINSAFVVIAARDPLTIRVDLD